MQLNETNQGSFNQWLVMRIWWSGGRGMNFRSEGLGFDCTRTQCRYLPIWPPTQFRPLPWFESSLPTIIIS